MREPRIAAEIAKQLHKFHQLDIPGSKEPQLWNDVFKFLKKGNTFNLFWIFHFGSGCFYFINIRTFFLKKEANPYFVILCAVKYLLQLPY
jgi:hypothetical protein